MSKHKELLEIEDSVLDEDSTFALGAVAKALKVIAAHLYKLAVLLEKLSPASSDCFRTCRAPFVCGSFNLCDTTFLPLGGLT